MTAIFRARDGVLPFSRSYELELPLRCQVPISKVKVVFLTSMDRDLNRLLPFYSARVLSGYEVKSRMLSWSDLPNFFVVAEDSGATVIAALCAVNREYRGPIGDRKQSLSLSDVFQLISDLTADEASNSGSGGDPVLPMKLVDKIHENRRRHRDAAESNWARYNAPLCRKHLHSKRLRLTLL